MPCSQPGNASGSASFGSADQAARNASWTTSSACCRSCHERQGRAEGKVLEAAGQFYEGFHIALTGAADELFQIHRLFLAPSRCRKTPPAFTPARNIFDR
jgi:hypothetical protein